MQPVREDQSQLQKQLRRSALLPLVLVAISLTLLALLPFAFRRYSDPLRDEIVLVAEPARQLVRDIQGALAIQTASARGYLLTEEPIFAVKHERARAQRRAAEAQLLSLTEQLQPRTAVDVRALTSVHQNADLLLDSLFQRRSSRPQYIARLNEQQERLEFVLAQAVRIDADIGRAVELRLARIRRADNLEALVAGLLVLLAGVSALLVARLGRRYRQLAIEAEQGRTDLEAVTESRTRLVRGFTHDVKNPLGAADGFLALLEEGIDGELSDAHKGRVARARRSIRSALDLVGQLLDLAKAESGQLDIHRAPMDPGAVAGEVVDAFKAQAGKRRQTLDLEVAPDTPPVESDADRVRQILSNLVSNAIKYTPEGGRIALSVARAEDGSGPSAGEGVLAAVRDNGPGIALAKQHLLFREYSRFNPGAAEGSGIGLAISQRIAEALGGHITIDSNEGQGSTFRLWLPLRLLRSQRSDRRSPTA